MNWNKTKERRRIRKYPFSDSVSFMFFGQTLFKCFKNKLKIRFVMRIKSRNLDDNAKHIQCNQRNHYNLNTGEFEKFENFDPQMTGKDE